MTVLNPVEFLEDFYVKDSSEIDVSFLAGLLGIQQKELAKTFNVSPTTASRKGIDSRNQTMQQWLAIFNLVADLIQASDLELDKKAVQLKMSRWLKLPNTHFNNTSVLEMMMGGKSRKVIRFLEQIDQ